ncbi:MAG: hypothetical protein AAGK04_05720 [Planctomycetota bacterium]
MDFLRKIKGGNANGEEPAADTPAAGGPPPSNPVNAKKFFDHAKVVQQAGNFEYAMQNWLGGLRQDPHSMEGLEGFWSAATAFAGENSKLSKETSKGFSGKGDLEKYLAALLAWGSKPTDGTAAVRAAENGAKLQILEPTYWIGERALMLCAADPKKAKKDTFTKLMDVFAAIGAPQKAAEAGDLAVRSDPGDTELSTRVRNLTAQATISGGGFDKTGEAGGFRANVRDMAKQQELAASDSVSKSEDDKERLLTAAEAAYAQRSDDLPTIQALVKALRDRGKPEDLKRALQVLDSAYKETKQFRFRQEAGEIQLRIARGQLNALRRAAEAKPDDQEAAQRYEKGHAKFLQMEIREYTLRAEAYPTDLGLKFELGKRYFDLGQYEQAIGLFQKSESDSKNRSAAQRYLGECFREMDLIDESIQKFRDAVEGNSEPDSDMGMQLRYGLLVSLESKARSEKDLDAAQEAAKIASDIAIRNFDFRDIKERLTALKQYVAELRG